MSAPDDIMDAAREALSALIVAGIEVHPTEQPKAIEVLAHALLTERERIQTDVMAAVADESEDCRSRVFTALRRVSEQ